MPHGSEPITVAIVDGAAALPPGIWNGCAGTENPFVFHGFFTALEESGSACAESGWMPQHLVAKDSSGTVLGIAPLYLKNHSFGEYVFDWGWADAYERAGGNYYPKLQSSVPFTPVTGPRFLVRHDAPGTVRDALILAMIQIAERSGISGVHVTFPRREEFESLKDHGFLPRIGQQFHWVNEGYATFDDFLAALSSRKRKAIRKERQAVRNSGIVIDAKRSADITESDWDAFYRFYRNTSDRKWGQSYLQRSFFSLLHERLGDHVLLFMALENGRPIGGALNLIGGSTLFGRTWGTIADYRFLHFETCYYQAIDYAIQHGFGRVEAGAQGSHKIQRGYLPVETYSAHWIADPRLRDALERYLQQEREAVRDEMLDLSEGSPFRRATSPHRLP